jgi:hypothetical protein
MHKEAAGKSYVTTDWNLFGRFAGAFIVREYLVLHFIQAEESVRYLKSFYYEKGYNKYSRDAILHNKLA